LSDQNVRKVFLRQTCKNPLAMRTRRPKRLHLKNEVANSRKKILLRRKDPRRRRFVRFFLKIIVSIPTNKNNYSHLIKESELLPYESDNKEKYIRRGAGNRPIILMF
jgi:hypothetical protein